MRMCKISVFLTAFSMLGFLTGCGEKGEPAVSETLETAASTVASTHGTQTTSVSTVQSTSAATKAATKQTTTRDAATTTKLTTKKTSRSTKSSMQTTVTLTESAIEETTEEKGWFDPSYRVDTSINYSAGDDSDWSYGNQRKEFSSQDSCYVRVGCTAITDKNKGVDHEIVVTYRFTGTKNCDVEVSEGIVTEVATNDTNIMEFTRSLYTKKEKRAEEDVVIFRYDPKAEGSITVEVIYDGEIESRYDKSSTIYFED